MFLNILDVQDGPHGKKITQLQGSTALRLREPSLAPRGRQFFGIWDLGGSVGVQPIRDE